MSSHSLRKQACFWATLVLSLGNVCVANTPANPAFSEQWRNILGADSTAASGIAVADVTGDGKPDMVFTGNRNGTSILFVLSQQADQSIGISQALVLPDTTGIVKVLSATIGGSAHVFTLAADGTLRDFSGWPLAEQDKFTVAANATSAAIGDLDGGGSASLVVLKALDGRIAKFKMPKRVFVVDELPRNAMGKVQKNLLREEHQALFA